MSEWQVKEKDHPQLVSLEEFQSTQKKYPGFLPIIIHPTDVKLTRLKYLTRAQIPFRQFVEIVRPYCLEISPQDALFFTVNGLFIPSNKKIEEIYDLHKKSDGYLHINVCPEPQFPPLPVVPITPVAPLTPPNSPSTEAPTSVVPQIEENQPGNEECSQTVKEVGNQPIKEESSRPSNEDDSSESDSLP